MGGFKPDSKILKLIESTNTQWHNESLKSALIFVESSAIEFFKRKGLIDGLKEIESSTKGTTFEMLYAFSDEVLNLAKMWLPSIQILQPQSLRDEFIKLLEKYIDKNIESKQSKT